MKLFSTFSLIVFFMFAVHLDQRGMAHGQEYQEYRPDPSTSTATATDGTATANNNNNPSFTTQVDAHGQSRSVESAQLNSVKKVISHVSIQNGGIDIPGVRHHAFDHSHSHGGYSMKDILIPQNKDGSPAVDLHKLNINVPALRKRTSYKPGHRKYLQQHTSTMLEIDRGFVYAFGDDIVVADASRVFIMGGCGENMAGWALASDGEHQEWDSPDLKKGTRAAVAFQLQWSVTWKRWGLTFFLFPSSFFLFFFLF